MKIAILGATSQIAKDLIISFQGQDDKQLYLFARRPKEVRDWLEIIGQRGRYSVNGFSDFANHDFDVVINFVGVGNPARAVVMGNSIFDITLKFDEMVLSYLQQNPRCRYLFLSSGAAYGSSFNEPAAIDTVATVPINQLAPQDWYGVAKLYAECRHRALPEYSIIDIRVFNYFSSTQDINARFLITDIIRAIRDDSVLISSDINIVRDYIHPSDFYRLIETFVDISEINAVVDCYSLAPIDKFSLLEVMKDRFNLKYQVTETVQNVNATGGKPNYYSLNTRAGDFGYQPVLNSMQGVLMEANKMLQLHDTRVKLS